MTAPAAARRELPLEEQLTRLALLALCMLASVASGCDKPKAPPPTIIVPEPPPTVQCAQQTGPRKLLWLDSSYHVNVDAEALRCLSEAERAVVGYVASLAGSGCDWADAEGAATAEHLDCKLTSAAELGFQCEAKHKDIVEQWLPASLPATCYKKPITAFSQEIFDTVSLSTTGPKITLVYSATGTSGPMGETWTWTDTLDFEVTGPTSLVLKAKSRKGKRPGG